MRLLLNTQQPRQKAQSTHLTAEKEKREGCAGDIAKFQQKCLTVLSSVFMYPTG